MTTRPERSRAPASRGLTPADLQNVRFTRASMMRPGYVDTEVDRVLSRVAEELGRLYAEKAALRDQVRSLQAQVDGDRDPRGAERPGGAHPLQRAADRRQLRRRGGGVQPPGHARRPRRVRGGDPRGPGDRRRDHPGGPGGGGEDRPGTTPAGGRRRRPHRGGAEEQMAYLRRSARACRVQLRSYLEALITDVEAEWGRADPAALPAEVVRPPAQRSGHRARPRPSSPTPPRRTRGRRRRDRARAADRRRRAGVPGSSGPADPGSTARRAAGIRAARSGRRDRLCQEPAWQRCSVPETTAAVGRARQHSVGDLLHRTARRYPDKLAVVAGDRRITYAEFDAAVNRVAAALAARGLAKGDRLALLSHNSLAVRGDWRSPPPGWASCSCRSTSCSGADEIAFILRHSGATGMVVEDALAPTAEKALAAAGVDGGVRGWIRAVRRGAAAGWEDVDDWWTDGPDARARRARSATTTRCG